MLNRDLTIQVTNWEKYNSTRVSKKGRAKSSPEPYWYFCFSHHFFSQAEIIKMTHQDIVIWIYILCECSKKDNGCARLSLDHLSIVTRIPSIGARSSILKLSRFGWLTFKYGKIKNKNSPIEENRIEENRIEENILGVDFDLPDEPIQQDLLTVWNQNCGTLPKVIANSKSREKLSKERLAEEKNLDVWADVVGRIAASAFCCGNNERGWKATFDWLLKPDTRLRVLEGKYDTRSPKAHDEDARRKREQKIRELSGGID